MKNLILQMRIVLTVLTFILVLPLQAQKVTVKSPSPNLKVEFKRCVENEDMTYIDILITNKSEQNTRLSCSGAGSMELYDNEGNIYKNPYSTSGKYKLYIATSNKDIQPLTSSIEIPAGIAYKAKIIVLDGFDKDATMIDLLKINFTWNVFDTKTYGSWERDSFELRNLPIVRE